MENEEIQAIDEDIEKKLPMWARKRLIYLKSEIISGRTHYTAEIEPLDADKENGNVFFDADSITDFRRQLQIYKKDYSRNGIDYMMFR